MAEVTITSRDLRQLGVQFRRAADGKELRKAFNKAVSAALTPVVAEVRSGYRALPSKGHASASRARQAQPDLRAVLARATGKQVRTSGRQAGVRVRVSGKQLPSGSKGLPKAIEGHGRWRHPVYGRRDVWVSQPSHPTFDPIVQRHVGRVTAAVNRIRDEIARKLERGGL